MRSVDCHWTNHSKNKINNLCIPFVERFDVSNYLYDNTPINFTRMFLYTYAILI